MPFKISLFPAPIIIGPGDNGTEIGGSIPPGGDQNCKMKVPYGGATVKVRSQVVSKMALHRFYAAHNQ